MHIIWKRPDGFQNALPNDFRRIQLSSGAQLWLHLKETDWYPFQVNGDWSQEEDTKKLNKLINLLDTPDKSWSNFLEKQIENKIGPKGEMTNAFVAEEFHQWIVELQQKVKGTTWELEIVKCALLDVAVRLKSFF